jgi:hypothetical protein
MKDGNIFLSHKDYDKALIEYQAAQVAARECEWETKEPADSLKVVFNAIRKLHEDAIKAKNEVEHQKKMVATMAKEVEEKNNDAIALLMTYESEKDIPMQEMRLLEKAYATAVNEDPRKIIKEKILKNFSDSRIHQYQGIYSIQKFSDIKFSPDSKWMITVEKDYGVTVLELTSGKKYGLLKENKISSPDFSRDGKWMRISSYRGFSFQEQLWELSSGKQPDFLKDEDDIKYISFSPDGKWIVANITDYKPKVWELANGKQPNFLSHEENIDIIIFSTDGRHMATKNEDSTVKIWGYLLANTMIFWKMKNLFLLLSSLAAATI